MNSSSSIERLEEDVTRSKEESTDGLSYEPKNPDELCKSV